MVIFCCVTIGWRVYFVDEYVLLKWMYVMKKTENGTFCILNILINAIHDVKYMSSILSYLNHIYNFTLTDK